VAYAIRQYYTKIKFITSIHLFFFLKVEKGNQGSFALITLFSRK
jgi:hypothetical protein